MTTHVVTVTPSEVAAARALIRLSGKDGVNDKVGEALVRLAEAKTDTEVQDNTA